MLPCYRRGILIGIPRRLAQVGFRNKGCIVCGYTTARFGLPSRPPCLPVYLSQSVSFPSGSPSFFAPVCCFLVRVCVCVCGRMRSLDLILRSEVRLGSIPSVHTKTYGQHAFSHSAPTVCNSLSKAIRNSDSALSFQFARKTFLFQLYH